MNSVLDIYITRIISLAVHIVNVSNTSKYMKEVKRHEEEKLIRVSNEIRVSLGSEVIVATDDLEDAKKVSAAVRDQLKVNHTKRSTSMAQHGLVKRKQENVEDHDEELTNGWLNLYTTSQDTWKGISSLCRSKRSIQGHCKSHVSRRTIPNLTANVATVTKRR